MAVVGVIVCIIIGLRCEAYLIVGGTGFWTWLFALGTEIISLFFVSTLSESIDSDSTLQKVINVIGTAFWLNALWLVHTAEGTAVNGLIALAGLLIAPYLFVVSLDAFFVDSVTVMVFIGIAKVASSVLLYTADLESFENAATEVPGKLVAYVAIISLLVLLFWIMAISRKIIANNKKKHEQRIREKISCSKQLIFAAGRNDRGTVLDLLEQGADVNYQDSYKDTPLSAAVTNGNVDMTVLLLEKGANIECEDKKGYTPLFYATYTGKIDIVSFLLEKGANIECKGKYKSTPLFAAICTENLALVSLLLEKGANIECENEDGVSPLSAAAANGYFDIAALLLENGANIEHECATGITPLGYAVICKNKEIVSLLLEKGADINHEGKRGYTPLMHAIDGENKEIISFLIEYGVNIEHETEDGITPLIHATLKKNKEMISFLLEKGANIEHESKHESTPLRSAIAANDKEIVSLLIEKGADVNLESPYDGHTPLSLAVAQNNKDVVLLLLKNGADPNKKDSKEGSPLMIAFSNGYKEICSLLMENGANSDEILWLTAVMQSTEVMQFFLDRGADVNCEDSSGLTPLKCAILTNYKEMVLLLISHGADVNFERSGASKKNAARTPLEAAIKTGNAEMVSLLITYGADVNYQTKNGNTPLMFAALHGKAEIVPILQKAGATSSVPPQNTRTSFSVSINSASQPNSDLSENSADFNSALVAFSKIIAKNGAEIFTSENRQKLTGLIADLIPKENDFAAILKQAFSCDFSQTLLEANSKSEGKKEKSFYEAVDKIIAEANLEKESAVLIVKLIALSLEWDLENFDLQ